MTILDGGFGTMVQAAGLPPGKDPTDWNVENPAAVAAVHRAYAQAGSQVVMANTFGANRLKYHGVHPMDELTTAAIRLARESGAEKVALDIGPSGRLLKPSGDLDFEEAYAAFAEQVRLGVAAGADLVIIETMGDTRELKSAVLAAKENAALPIWATVALGEDGKLLTGASAECVAELLEGLGVDAYGFNCGLGPDRMLPFVERLAKVSTRPIIVKPNAGMPQIVDGKTVFTVGPDEFAAHVRHLVDAGARIIGGCCGTTPAHMAAIASIVPGERAPSPHRPDNLTRISSGLQVVDIHSHDGLVIGERINPTGKKLLREALKSGDVAYVMREAVKQTDANAVILDVNCGVPGIDEAEVLDHTLVAVESVATVPLQIDTSDPRALERALRHVNGKPLVNSVNGSRKSMDAVFPLVHKHGGVMVALCLDEAGIPETADGRLAIARRIIEEGAKYGFGKSDFVFDALTLAVSADKSAALVTLETVKRLTEEIGVNTVLGVSNVSFGLPNRPALNNAMYTLAKRAGLSAAIVNPSVIAETDDEAAFDVLLGRDENCLRWIAKCAEQQAAALAAGAANQPGADLKRAIIHGLKDDARQAAATDIAGGKPPMSVVQNGIVPALEEVGGGFEKGRVFLPQLLMAADAAGAAFEAVRAALKAATAASGETDDAVARPIVVATVKGDVHDIGKNIVRALLENYGFRVIDLGRDVAPERVVESARESNAFLVGLSALMTTTVGAMAETIRQLKAAGLDCRTCVGGAVVTQEYADEIGADFYGKDAMRTVRIAESLVKKS
mgnify:FL=1